MTEEKNLNPLQHQMKMTKTDWVLTYALSLLIFPIRIILLLIIMLVTIIVAKIGLLHIKTEELCNKPLRPLWRKIMRKIVWILLRCFIRACSFCITTKGERALVEEAPLLIFAPHTSFFDMFAAWYNEVGGVASQTTFEPKSSPPILRNFFLWAALICQNIIVKRNDDSSRRNASKEILMRVQNVEKYKSEDETWPQFEHCRFRHL